jgi:SAM-dependent methyltransferase
MTQLTHNFVTATLTAVAAFVVARQCRKPGWIVGRLFLATMNVRHSAVTRWGLSHVSIEKHFTMLDVGCGGGKTIDTLAGLAPEGKVYGVDYSSESVAASRRHNARWIEQGRVVVQRASVASLPFPANTFDLVTAIETHYYWPDPARDLGEILRVLKPGCRFALVAETYKGRRFDWLYRPAMALLSATYLTVDEHRELLTKAGFAEVGVFEERASGWICAVGRKPVSTASASSTR